MSESTNSEIASAINETLKVSDKEFDEPDNVADGLFALAKAIDSGFTSLGLGGASTPMGAIEVLGLAVKEAGENIARSLSEIAEAIREHGYNEDSHE